MLKRKASKTVLCRETFAKYKYGAGMNNGNDNPLTPPGSGHNTSNDLYLHPWTRCVPYAVGMLAGFIVVRRRDSAKEAGREPWRVGGFLSLV